MPPPVRGRFWLGTCFAELANKDAWEQYVTSNTNVQGVLGQQEVCPSTGRTHWQLYFILEKRWTLRTMRESLGTLHCHLEPRRGSHGEAIEYCTKLDTRLEGGDTVDIGGLRSLDGRNQPGRRMDLQRLQQQLDDGVPIADIASTSFTEFLRFHRGLVQYSLLRQPQRSSKTRVVVLYGDSGTGKSMSALDLGGTSAYWLSNKWWCGYHPGSSVVIDDFKGWLPFDFLLRLLDRYPLNVECKGGQICFNSELIVITSNSHPAEWYEERMKNSESERALARRVDELYCFLRNPIRCIKETWSP